MKIYRGPSTKPLWDNTHELVSSIPSEKLEASIRDGTYIKFNITKDNNERQAVCTAFFDNEDIVPMINGLMSKLKSQQMALLEIKKIMANQEQNKDAKLDEISKIVKQL